MSIIKEEVDLDSTEVLENNCINSTSQFKEANHGKSLVNHNARKLPSWLNSCQKECSKIVTSINVKNVKQESEDNDNNANATISSSMEYVKKEYDESSPNTTILSDKKCVKQEPSLYEDNPSQSTIEVKNNEIINSVLKNTIKLEPSSSNDNEIFNSIHEKIIKQEPSCSNESDENAEIITTDVNDLKTSNEASGNNHESGSSPILRPDEKLPLPNCAKNSDSNNHPTSTLINSSNNIAFPPSDISAQLNSTTNIDDSASPTGSIGKRMNCRYGSSCYRFNVQHKQQFSHPRDYDYDGDAECDSTSDRRKFPKKPTCWYGSNCFRKNEEHLQKFNHPSSSSTPSKRKRKPNIVEVNCRIRSSNGSFDSTDSDEYDDSFIDDNSSDEFRLTDSADEEEFSDFDESSSESENDTRLKGGAKKKKKFSLF